MFKIDLTIYTGNDKPAQLIYAQPSWDLDSIAEWRGTMLQIMIVVGVLLMIGGGIKMYFEKQNKSGK
jgi:hypothetical protein